MDSAGKNHISLKKYGLANLFLVSLLLLPTLYMFYQYFVHGTSISIMIKDVWSYNIHNFSSIQKFFIKSSYFIAIISFALIYYKGLRYLSDKNINCNEKKLTKQIFLWAAAIGLILVFVAPFSSTDLYGYINRGVQQVFYNVNPYITPLTGIKSWQLDLMFHEHWVNNPAPYGFFFVFLTKTLCFIAGRHFFITFLLFKFINLALFLSTGWLLYQLCSKFNMNRPWLSAYIFLWNPLVLLQGIANGHNDIILAFFLVASIALLTVKKWSIFAIPLLMLSILVKYASLLALPFIAIYFIKRKEWKILVSGGLLATIFLILLGSIYLPDFFNNHNSLSALTSITDNALFTGNSLHFSLYKILQYISELFPVLQLLVDPAQKIIKTVLWLGYIIFYSFLVLDFSRKFSANIDQQKQIKDLIKHVATAMLIMIVFVSSKFYAWYVCMFFPLIVMLEEDSFIRRFAIILSIFQLLLFTPLEKANIANFVVPTLIPLFITFKFFNYPLKLVNRVKGYMSNIDLSDDLSEEAKTI